MADPRNEHAEPSVGAAEPTEPRREQTADGAADEPVVLASDDETSVQTIAERRQIASSRADRQGDGSDVGDVMLEGDSLPEDLDVTAYVGQYQFPSMRRRRVAAVIYAVVGAFSIWGWTISSNGGLLAAGIVLAVLAVHHWLTAWALNIDQTEALGTAAKAVGFPVGHASAQVAWRGFASRPTWRVLLYSAEEPPLTRGLAEIDGVDGEVLATHTEDNPEDWSAYGAS